MRLVWLALLAGCYHPASEQACTIRCPCPSGLTCSADGVCVDSSGGCGGTMVDAATSPDVPDAPPVCVTGQTGSYLGTVCLDGVVPVTLNGAIDTDQPCMATGDSRLTSYCVEYGSVVTLSNVSASGSKPLVVIATDTLVITGTLDVSSYHLGPSGAAANTGPCTSPGDGGAQALGGGGGAGGAFHGNGGDGGNVNGLGGGTAAFGSATPPPTLMGGCPGAMGASYAGSGVAFGGMSGGALYLMAQNQISLANGSAVLAVGAGGLGGHMSGGGGGGGGSGGMIVFDTMHLVGCPGATCVTTPIVIAHGGGGGGGASFNIDGQPGKETNTINGAAGGAGAGNGGMGSSDLSINGSSGTPVSTTSTGVGAGGGGGGDGFTRALVTDMSFVTFSPAPL